MARGPAYSDEDNRLLRTMAASGAHPADVAVALGRAERSIRVRASVLGIKWACTRKPGAGRARKGGTGAARAGTGDGSGKRGPDKRKRVVPPKTRAEAVKLLARLGAGSGADPGQVSALKAFIDLSTEDEAADPVLGGMRRDIRDWARANATPAAEPPQVQQTQGDGGAGDAGADADSKAQDAGEVRESLPF